MRKTEITIPLNLKINPHSYIEMSLNFEKYIQIIDCFGGAIFQKQLDYYINKSYKTIQNHVKRMEEFNIVEVIRLNNNNVVKNKTFAVRYLRQSTTYSAIKITSLGLKSSAYLAEFIYSVYGAEVEKTFLPLSPAQVGKKIYGGFLADFQKKLEEHNAGVADHLNFLQNYKNIITAIKDEYDICKENHPQKKDFLTKLKLSRIYVYDFDEVDNIIKFAIIDNSVSQVWLRKNLLRIDKFLKRFNFFKFDIVILAGDVGRAQRLQKDIEQIQKYFERHAGSHENSVRLLRNFDIVNTDADRFFKHNSEFDSFLSENDENIIAKAIKELKND